MLAPTLCGLLGQTFGMVIFPFYLILFLYHFDTVDDPCKGGVKKTQNRVNAINSTLICKILSLQSYFSSPPKIRKLLDSQKRNQAAMYLLFNFPCTCSSAADAYSSSLCFSSPAIISKRFKVTVYGICFKRVKIFKAVFLCNRHRKKAVQHKLIVHNHPRGSSVAVRKRMYPHKFRMRPPPTLWRYFRIYTQGPNKAFNLTVHFTRCRRFMRPAPGIRTSTLRYTPPAIMSCISRA